MKFPRPLIIGGLLLPLAASLALAQSKPGDLAAGFQSPPESARPRTWWHWVGGNVSSEGITADLEAMKRVGLGGAQIFTVDQTAVRGPVKFMSPEWRQLVHLALSEGGRLGLEMAMEDCEGWSESGGPWIKPDQAMQQVVWSESHVTGGQTVSLALTQPPTFENYYEDIATLAFPSRVGDVLPEPVQVKANSADFDGSKVIDHDYATQTMLNTKPAGPFWIQLNYAAPITCRSLNLQTDRRFGTIPGELQTSDDGVNFKKGTAIVLCGCSSLPPTTSKYFRIYFAKGPTEVPVKEVRLGGARIDHWEERTGLETLYPEQDVPFDNIPMTADEIIDPAGIVDLSGKKEWAVPAGNWTVVRIGHTCTGLSTHPSAVRGLEADKLSRADVDFHFHQMFDPVFQDSPSLIGTSLRDVMLDSWEAGCENWTPLIRDDFKKRRGYDLGPWLLTLTGRVVQNAETTERFLWDYRRTLADLVAENHYGTIQDLAHEHHLGVYAEAVGINTQTVADQLQCKGRTDVPMGEFWIRYPKFNNVDDPKEAACAAHIYGQNLAAAEAYTSQPDYASWANDPYSMKALGDMELCLGINRFVFHRYAHQPWLDRQPGMSMGPYGINFERTNTWWEEGKAWMTYLSRCQQLLQQGRFAADLCYFLGEGAPMTLRQANLSPAPPAGFDYDACNAEILLNQMSVDNGQIVLKSGMRYRVLVLPNLDRMSVRVLTKIKELVNAGATVYGPRPKSSPSLTGFPENDRSIQSMAQEVWGSCDGQTVTEHTYGKGKIAWGEPLKKTLTISADFASPNKDLLFIHRHDEPADLYFVSNQGSDAVTTECTFRVSGKIPELWHPDTGVRETVALYKTENGLTTLPIHFDPVGSVFVVFREPAPASPPLAAIQFEGENLFASKSDSFASVPVLSGDGITLAASKPGAYEIVGGPAGKQTLTVPALPAPKVLAGAWQIAFPPKLGAPERVVFDHLISWPDAPDEGIKYFSGTAAYTQDFELSDDFVTPNRRLYLDLGAVKNIAELTLNGKSLGILWKAPFRVDITAAAKRGANHLEIKVTNLWPNRLIGDQKLPANQRITWASVTPYNANSPLLPSGLLGPVTVSAAQEIKFRLGP